MTNHIHHASFLELTKWLHSRGPQLVSIIEDVIIRQKIPGFPLGRDVSPEYVLAQVLRASKSLDFHRAFRDAVFDLLHMWSSERYYRHLGSLFLLVAQTGATQCRPSLLSFAGGQSLKGRESMDGEDLHLRLLRVIVGLGVTRSIAPVFVRDLSEPLYTGICYTALYRIKLGYALTYLPDVIRVALKDPHAISFEFVFARMLATFGRQQFLRRVRRLCGRLTPLEIALLAAAMHQVNLVADVAQGERWLRFVDPTESVTDVEELHRFRLVSDSTPTGRGAEIVKSIIQARIERTYELSAEPRS